MARFASMKMKMGLYSSSQPLPMMPSAPPPPPPPPRARFRTGQVSNPYAKGKLRNISRGIYTAGPLMGHDCIVKWFQRGNESNEAVFFEKGLATYAFAQQVCASWNELCLTKPITVGTTDIWKFKDHYAHKHDHNVLVEQYIHGKYYHWNSNSGYVDYSICWGKVMQSLSHYSYHISQGQMLLCDLQGGFDKHTGSPVIVSPAVCSLNQKLGNTDTGTNGMYAFFKNYKPTEYTSKSWIKPHVPSKYKTIIKPKKTTTFFDVQKNVYV